MKNFKFCIEKLTRKLFCVARLIILLFVLTSIVVASPGNELYPLGQESEQSKNIKGSVVDESGMPVIGASVVVKESTNGTVTDIDGKFNLNVQSNAVLEVSYIGYVTQQVVVKNNTLKIVLREDFQKLNEVVVVGYGAQKRKEVTSSIASVKSESFTKGATTNPLQLIQGKVAGLNITKQNGNDPNSDLGIQIRGVSSASAGTSPLIVVDGIPGASLHSIAQDDIESMDVLRDGSAAAIYGTRGSNGVIIITTKKGKDGTRKLEYNGYVSLEGISKNLRLLNREEFLALEKDGYAVQDLGASINWFDELTNKASFSHNHNLSMTGGTDLFNYRASLYYKDMQPVVINTGRKEYGGRINVNNKSIDNRLTIQLNVSNKYTNELYTNYGIFQQAINRPPTIPIMDPEIPTNYYETSGWDYYNPVAYQNQFDNKGESMFLNGDVKASFDVISGLKASLLVAMNKHELSRFNYLPSSAKESVMNGWAGRAGRSEDSHLSRMLEATIDYSLLNVENHSLSAFLGYSYQDFTNHYFNATNYNFSSDAFGYNNLGNGSFLKEGRADLGTSRDESKLISFFGRVNYGYKDKYLFSASLRREGSTKFGANNKWGFFPAVSAGWRISQESFMKDMKIINDLKLRIGYGVTGNQDFGSYKSLSKLGDGGKYYDATTGTFISVFGQGNNPNPDLKWEKKHELNVGLDISLLDSRVNVTLDIYNRRTNDLLFNTYAQKPPMVHDNILMNIGSMNNSGVELLLNFVPIKSKDITWETSLTYAYNKNKLISLSGTGQYMEYGWLSAPGNPGNAFRMEEGHPVASFYGLRYAGLNENGKWLFKKEDGTLGTRAEITELDKVYLGNGAPDMFASWNNTIRYKKWDLSLFFRGAFGFEICNMKEMIHGNKNQLPKNVLYSAITKHRDLKDDAAWSDYYLEKGDYLKLDNVTLGYNFNLNNKYVKNMHWYVSGQNIFTITSYSGVDPEVSQAGLEAGVDAAAYFPRTRTFSLGVSIDF